MSDRSPTATPYRRFIDEWNWLRRRRDLVERAQDWQLVEGTLTDLDQLVGAVHHTTIASERERRLHRLIEIGTDDDLAIRILLQAFLPDLERLHRKRRAQGWSQVDFGDLLATGWIVIRTYNPRRRPASLANSLVSDIDWQEYRAALRRKGDHHCTLPTEFDRLADHTEPTAIEELSALLRDARAAGISPGDLELLRQMASGHRTVDVAESLGVTPRTIRNRRERVAAALRKVALAA
jgi:DNA-binding CsgD family transcriptional regulator